MRDTLAFIDYITLSPYDVFEALLVVRLGGLHAKHFTTDREGWLAIPPVSPRRQGRMAKKSNTGQYSNHLSQLRVSSSVSTANFAI